MIVDQSQAWERAAVRAAARGLTAEWIRMAGQGQVVTEYWKTDSTSNPGSFHYVRLNYNAEGIDALCDCAAGQREVPCAHAAAVIEASQAMLEEPQSEHAPIDGKTAKRILFGDLAAD